MKYRLSCYTDIILEACRFMLGSLTSLQFAMAVLFTGIFATKMLNAFEEPLHIQNVVFLPCACFFLWSFCVSAIDMNIERDVL